ncbi:MAG: VWA domain-containing protein [Treponema sp.]|nr:VWA domain-containing protein [Treponema sp.]
MITFENPAAFLLLLLPPLYIILRKTGLFKRLSFPLTLGDWGGTAFIWNGTFRSIVRIFSKLLGLAAYIAAVAACADPIMQHQEKIFTSRGSDILLVLDTSPSMAARDIAGGSRLEAAKTGIRTLIEANRGISFGLVTMGSEAATVVPPTADHELFFKRLETLAIGTQGNGSAIGTGLSTAIYHLITSTAPKKCIVLITDGENNAGEIHPETAAELARENEITIYTFGIGTKGSVPVEYVDPDTGKLISGYYESEFNPKPLEDIARIGGGQYFSIETMGALSSALAAVGTRENVIQTYHMRSSDTHYYNRLLLICAVCAILGWCVRRLCLQEVC